jgi:hypothetical protein
MATLNTRGLSFIAGMLFISATAATQADAQIARPITTASPAMRIAAPLPTPSSPSEPAQSPAAAPAASSASPQQMLYYVCGDQGIDSHVTSPDPQHPFNLGVSFVSASSGSPLTDVSVKVRRHGRVLMDFVAAGPYCLFSVPEADYRIEGTYHGEMKFGIVQTGTMNAQIKW